MDEEKIQRNDDHETRNEGDLAADRKIEQINAELSALGPGTRIQISRVRPSWCKGYLEKIAVGEDGIDIDYLIKNWGGQSLNVKVIGPGSRVRGSYTIELYSWPPRRRGKLLKEFDEEDEENEAPKIVPTIHHSPEITVFQKMLETFNSQRQSEVDTLRALLMAQMEQARLQNVPAPVQAPVQQNPMAELVKAAKYYQQLQGFLGSPEHKNESSDDFPRQIMDMAKMFMSAPQPQQPRAKLVDSPPRSISPVKSIPAVAPVENNVKSTATLVSQLANLDAEEAAQTLADAFSMMDPGRQDQAWEAFMRRFNETMPGFFDEEEKTGSGNK